MNGVIVAPTMAPTRSTYCEVAWKCGTSDVVTDRAPVGMGEHGGDRIGEEDDGEGDEDALGEAVGAAHQDRPDQRRRQPGSPAAAERRAAWRPPPMPMNSEIVIARLASRIESIASADQRTP